jgi:hypothetical protein
MTASHLNHARVTPHNQPAPAFRCGCWPGWSRKRKRIPTTSDREPIRIDSISHKPTARQRQRSTLIYHCQSAELKTTFTSRPVVTGSVAIRSGSVTFTGAGVNDSPAEGPFEVGPVPGKFLNAGDWRYSANFTLCPLYAPGAFAVVRWFWHSCGRETRIPIRHQPGETP